MSKSKKIGILLILVLLGIFLWIQPISIYDLKEEALVFDASHGLPFEPIPPCFAEHTPNQCDAVRLPPGFSSSLLISWRDRRLVDPNWFGFNNDLVLYFPLDALEGGNSSSKGLLWVNHEYTSSLLFHGKKLEVRDRDQIEAEKDAHGGSLFQVEFDEKTGLWNIDPGLTDKTRQPNPLTRRITAKTPVLLTGPAAGSSSVRYRTEVRGTVADCGGNKTPWNTILVAEENYHLYTRNEPEYTNWEDVGEKFFETHYGWIMEVDPFDPRWEPRKHTSLGRMKHENAALTVSRETGKVVVYLGEDAEDRFLFKFVSEGVYQPTDREHNKTLLTEGVIYAAGFNRMSGRGEWIPLTLDNPRISDRFEDEAEMLVNLPEAAGLFLDLPKMAKKSRTIPFSRSEDVEIHPLDGSVYVALTENISGGDFFGEILRLVEEGDPAVSRSFVFERFSAGGLPEGFSNPDNLVFDSRGNLWVAEDISGKSLNRGIYRGHGNNGLWMIPTAGPLKGRPFRFATAPNGAEFTGPWFSPDGKTLFLSVQHPGETTLTEGEWTSHWPPDDDPRPRPGVIAIRGFH